MTHLPTIAPDPAGELHPFAVMILEAAPPEVLFNAHANAIVAEAVAVEGLLEIIHHTWLKEAA